MSDSFSRLAAWSRLQMPRTQRALQQLPDLHGVRMAMSMHLDIKMLPLVEGLREKGAELYITTCNPTTVRNEVVDAMRDCGTEVNAWKDMPMSAYQAAIQQALAWEPTHLCEMGADFTYEIQQQQRQVPNIIASLEATGSGVNRLQGILPTYPIFNWDDLPVKEGLHNRHMVGLTTWHAFFNTTRLSLHEKKVLIVGYGTVGQGLADSARAYGGQIMVAEADPARRVQAAYDGWLTGSVEELAPLADVICTATGAHHVVPWSVLQQLKDGCFLLNSGHRQDEIEHEALDACPHETALPLVEGYTLPSGHRVYLIANGAMANLTAGEGDSLNAFDVTLAVMTTGIGHIVGEGSRASAGVYLLPQKVWQPAL
ncbi:adenosylhomocysteinase [Pokkaliibacter sp. MBI-7]|uniref:adenosylhomocysteinase n=1 Tax=Pokkaliibacter sp. MBI-7 TaxID=3040600 RepID=UPI00244ADB0D|nr:adenosylhomocysteinase [Pokkaliibacter sp. MBI-7]MDH2435783.1 adenosylhomocysteinase [Pokkaliibacter sp. MBI-7]